MSSSEELQVLHRLCLEDPDPHPRTAAARINKTSHERESGPQTWKKVRTWTWTWTRLSVRDGRADAAPLSGHGPAPPLEPTTGQDRHLSGLNQTRKQEALLRPT